MNHYAMRRADRALSREEALAVLDSAPFVTLSMVGENGEPYGVPLSFVRTDTTLYVHTTNDYGRKLDCFRRDGRACAVAVTEVEAFFAEGDFSTSYRSALAFGRIREVGRGVEFRRALVNLCLKYVPDAKAHIGEALRASGDRTAVWALEIDELSGKAQPRVDAGASASAGAGASAGVGSTGEAN